MTYFTVARTETEAIAQVANHIGGESYLVESTLDMMAQRVKAIGHIDNRFHEPIHEVVITTRVVKPRCEDGEHSAG
jgi:hypothetical protein